MKFPLAYIQGPPGTGKTNTIINTIVTAFFNEKTVLFSSYNNHPISGVFEKLSGLHYRGKRIPFPALRLGNMEKVEQAISYIKSIYEETREIKIFEGTLDRRKDDRIERAKKLSGLLGKYEEVLDLKERSETLKRMMEYQDKVNGSISLLPFQADLQGRQLAEVEKQIALRGEITDEDAVSLLDNDEDELYQYLYYTSARYIKRLDEGKYEDLRKILFAEDKKKQVLAKV